MSGPRRAFARVSGVALLAVLAISSSAAADHGLLEQVSVGGNGAFYARFGGASQDGTRAFFETDEVLSAADTDTGSSCSFPRGCTDVYERSGGTTTLVSTGPLASSGTSQNARFRATSTDGTRVFFETSERLVSADTNSVSDVYERSGGTTTLVSAGPSGSSPSGGGFASASADGTRVFFSTFDALVPGDTDSQSDVYERSGGTTTLVSTGPSGGNGPFFVRFRGTSTDGTQVFFETEESLVGSDTDSNVDVYERSGGTTTLVSTGPTSESGFFPATFGGASDDGSKLFFQTDEKLVAADTDGRTDVYERSGSTTSLISIGSLGGNGNLDASFAGASRDGTRAFFTTFEHIESVDFDGSRDIYERFAGATTLISTAPVSGGQANVEMAGTSSDGTHVFFLSPERLTTDDDDDGQIDVYERFAGTTTLISKGPLSQSGTGFHPTAAFNGSSEDGTRVFFSTAETLVPQDVGTFDDDVYERFADETTLISTGPRDGGGSSCCPGALFRAVTPNGSRVFFETGQNLVSSDQDPGSGDVYAAIVNYVRPKGATPLRVSLVPAFAECTSPNSSHGSPLAFGSCNPPAQASSNLTIGTPDANGAGANSVGTVAFNAMPGNPAPPDDSDVSIHASLTDVRCQAGVSTCGPANTAAGADYTGQLQGTTSIRMTDRLNGTVPTNPGTVTDTPFSFTLSCAPTASVDEGGTCAVATSANALTPGAIRDGKRTVWELGQLRVLDGGPDGAVATTPNALFAAQGVFVP